MSSILDALNKLEDERERDAANARAALDAELAARDLMGEGEGSRYSVSLGPIALAGAGIALVLVVAATAGLVGWLMRAEPAVTAAVPASGEVSQSFDTAIEPSTPPQTAAAVGTRADKPTGTVVEDETATLETAGEEPPNDESLTQPSSDISANGWAQALALSAGVPADEFAANVADASSSVTHSAATVQDEPSPSPEPAHAARAPQVTHGDIVAADNEPSKNSVDDVAPTPDQLLAVNGPVVVGPPEEESTQTATEEAPSMVEAPPLAEVEPELPALPTSPPEDSLQLNAFDVAAASVDPAPAQVDWPEDMRELPALSPAAKAKLSLDDFVVNMPMPATNARPVASAIINRMKVYKNERVLNTRVRLVDVSTHGVAIEVIDTGERYYVRH